MNEVIVQNNFSVIECNGEDIVVVTNEKISVISEGIQGPPGPPGNGVASHIVFPFAYNNVASQVIYTFANNGHVFGVRAEIKQVFNAAGASIGIDSGVLDSDEIDVYQAMVIDKSLALPFSIGAQIRLLITPGVGGTQGDGEIVLEVG